VAEIGTERLLDIDTHTYNNRTTKKFNEK